MPSTTFVQMNGLGNHKKVFENYKRLVLFSFFEG